MSQRERLLSHLINEMQLQPDAPRPSFPDMLIFRTRNGKQFVRFQTVSEMKFGGKAENQVYVISLRCDPLLGGSLRLEKGFHRAYAEDWISIQLDFGVEDEMLISLLQMAYALAEGGSNMMEDSSERSWLVPANPKYFDLFAAFEQNDIILWKQSSNISVGDIVYLYVASPYSAILFRCRAVEVDIPYTKKNSRRHITRAMRIQRLCTYSEDAFPLDILKTYGVTTVRGPRSVPPALRKKLEDTAKK